jgi:hypothetical protein
VVNFRERGTRSERAKEKSAQDISQDQGLAQCFCHAPIHNGGAENVGEIAKKWFPFPAADPNLFSLKTSAFRGLDARTSALAAAASPSV